MREKRGIKLKMVLLLVFGLTIAGCGEGKFPSWLKFGRAKIEPQVPIAERVEGTTLAKVDTETITLEDFNSRIEAYNAEIQAASDIADEVKENYLIKSKEDKKRLLDGMVERKLLVAEAVSRGLDKDRGFKSAIDALREQLLFAKLIEAEKAKVNVSTKEIENFYNTNQQAFALPEERKISMIVVANEGRAREILIALLQGGDFAALARANSTDGSAANDGDIGFIVQTLPFPQPGPKTMFKKLEEVAFALELNKPSTIFQGPDGFYIIKVTEINESRQRMLSEVYNDIEQGLLLKKQDDALKTLVGNLRKSANIIMHNELLKE